MRNIIVALGVCLLAACGMFGGGDKDDKVGMSFSDAGALAPDLAPENGRIFVYRQRAALGSVVSADVTLNGEIVGDSEAGGFFYVDRPAGNYQLSAKQSEAAGSDEDRKVSFTLAAGQDVYVKISIAGVVTTHVNADRVEQPQALSEMQPLRYGKPKYF